MANGSYDLAIWINVINSKNDNVKDYYRLTDIQKANISQNLIDILEKDIVLPQRRLLLYVIGLTDRSEKFKAYYDVWEFVLKNFYPKSVYSKINCSGISLILNAIIIQKTGIVIPLLIKLFNKLPQY